MNFESDILSYLSRPGMKPPRSRELARKLGVSDDQYPAFRQVLRTLEESGRIARGGGGKWTKPEATEGQLAGVIEVKRGGFGFFVCDAANEEDLFIPEEGLNGAMNGDRVLVEPARGGRGKGALSAAKVVRVLERAIKRIVCRVITCGREILCDPDDPRIASYFSATLPDGMKVFPDDKVLVEITAYPERGGDGRGTIMDRLGPAGEPETEIAAILAQFDTPVDFPEDVLEQVRGLSMVITAAERAQRLDFTDDLCVTIDPVDARDFDDAISITRSENGWRLGVHIADVSHFVTPGSPLDREARNRSTSIYLPGRVIPMLPPELSNDLCSLRPNEERFAMSVFMDVSPEGEVSNPECFRSIIRSRRRMTYEEVFALFTNAEKAAAFDDPDVLSALRMMRSCAGVLRRRRFEHGSVELDLPEYKVLVDDLGKAVGMMRVEHDESHQLVEDCMLAANVALAQYASKRQLPILYRVHDEPDRDRIESLAEFLDACGYHLALPMTRQGLNRILEKARGTPEEHAVNLVVLTSMQQAVYSPQCEPHFALGFGKYTHFTSPIRRYPDLFLHQQLKACIPDGESRLPARTAIPESGSPVEIVSLGLHTSARERQAMKIEGDVVNFRRLELLGKSDRKIHKARITGIRSFGVFVTLEEFFVEAMLTRDELASHGIATEAFLPNAEERLRRGRKPKGRRERRKTEGGFHLGEDIMVTVRRIDMAGRTCELEYVGRAGEYRAR